MILDSKSNNRSDSKGGEVEEERSSARIAPIMLSNDNNKDNNNNDNNKDDNNEDKDNKDDKDNKVVISLAYI